MQVEALARYRQQDWEGAFKLYQAILVHHAADQTSEETVEVYHRLGVIKTKQGERKKALNFFEKALEIDTSHRATLNAVIELQLAQNDIEAVVNAKRALMPVADDNERRLPVAQVARPLCDGRRGLVDTTPASEDLDEMPPARIELAHAV